MSQSFGLTNAKRKVALVSLALIFLAVNWQAPSLADAPSDAKDLIQKSNAFLKDYCVDCHHQDDPSGDRAFDTVDFSDTDQDNLILLQDIVDQLTLGDMPPEDATQPDDSLRRKAINQLRQQIKILRERSESTGGQTVLRRLSRREYLATIRDLFQLDISMFDPTERFPRDNTTQHLDNIGSTLVTSGFLLEQYLDAADAVVEKALATLEQPTEQQWVFENGFKQQPELDGAHREAFQFDVMCLYDSPLADRPEGAYGALHDFEHGVPVDGFYEIRINAQALHRDTPYSPQRLRIDLTEPFRLGIRPGKLSAGSLHNLQPIQPLLQQKVIEDETLKWYTFRVRLDKGFIPRFTFENGLEAIRPLYGKLYREYADSLPKKVRGKSGIVAHRKALLRYGQMPQIRIHRVEIRGPLVDDWPPPSVRSVLPDGAFESQHAEKLIKRFAERAYRRSVSDDELQRLMAVYQTRLHQGQNERGAFKDTLKVGLCSPAFLYLDPQCKPKSDELSQHALASRLSYFLTGSMPDEELRALADEGRLDEQQLLKQTRRLMKDERSKAFHGGLTDAWLNLRALGEMPPDRGEFWRYYASDLRQDMRTETQLFLQHLIEDDLPVTRWLDADYSFINRDLARLYGVVEQVPSKDADVFRKVVFTDRRRGGLLGQASVLTVSANGIETSPVIRGVWMLENVLGTPPAAPPDDVPAIDPDVRGAKSIRDLLEKHRTTAACNECHRKIDPLGFALESFDPIGQIRDRYDKRTKVDTSGKLPSGQEFDDLVGLKKLLIQRKAFFARAFIEKTFAYALGRHLEPNDRGAVDKILESTEANDYPTRTVIEQIVMSDLFRRR